MNKVIKSYILPFCLFFGLLFPAKTHTFSWGSFTKLVIITASLAVIYKYLYSSTSQSWKGIPNAVYFYDRNKSYYSFTNFSEDHDLNKTYQFKIGEQQWGTVEQYYQAEKFPKDSEHQKAIRDFISDSTRSAAGKAFNYAQTNKACVCKNWSKISIKTMLTAVRAKFKQNDCLKSKLLGTGDKILIEDSPHDVLYGRGKDYTGQNHLGRILMHVRDELKESREKQYNPATTYALPYVLSTLKK